MQTVSLDSILTLADDAKIHDMVDEAIIHLPGASEAITVNASALAILISCNGVRSVADVIALLAHDLGVADTAIGDDVLAAAQEMVRLGVLTLV